MHVFLGLQTKNFTFFSRISNYRIVFIHFELQEAQRYIRNIIRRFGCFRFAGERVLFKAERTPYQIKAMIPEMVVTTETADKYFNATPFQMWGHLKGSQRNELRNYVSRKASTSKHAGPRPATIKPSKRAAKTPRNKGDDPMVIDILSDTDNEAEGSPIVIDDDEDQRKINSTTTTLEIPDVNIASNEAQCSNGNHSEGSSQSPIPLESTLEIVSMATGSLSPRVIIERLTPAPNMHSPASASHTAVNTPSAEKPTGVAKPTQDDTATGSAEPTTPTLATDIEKSETAAGTGEPINPTTTGATKPINPTPANNTAKPTTVETAAGITMPINPATATVIARPTNAETTTDAKNSAGEERNQLIALANTLFDKHEKEVAIRDEIIKSKIAENNVLMKKVDELEKNYNSIQECFAGVRHLHKELIGSCEQMRKDKEERHMAYDAIIKEHEQKIAEQRAALELVKRVMNNSF